MFCLAVVLLCWGAGLHAQDTLEVGGTRLVQRAHSLPNPVINTPIQEMRVYRSDPGGEKQVLAYTQFSNSADGHYEEVELGKLVVRGDSLIVYTWWMYAGEDMAAPFGARKRIYRLEGEKAKLLGGVVYLETGLRSEGRAYLHEAPVDDDQHKVFQAYVRNVQAEHQSTFVFGKASDALLTETKGVLGTEIDAVKARWRKTPP